MGEDSVATFGGDILAVSKTREAMTTGGKTSFSNGFSTS